jgi:hypothetical protein
MCRKIFSLLVIVSLFFLPSLGFASTLSQELVNQGRGALFKKGAPTWQGILDSNDKFKAAVQADDTDQTAHLFYALTRLGSFVLKTDDTDGFQTLADIIQAMGVPFQLNELMDNEGPFGKLPELNNCYNPPVTMPDGDDLRAALYPGLANVIDLALADLEKIGPEILVTLTAQEIDDFTDILVDYTDVLLFKAVLSTLKTMVLFLSAYDLDAADLREIMALANSSMIDLHPNMINELLVKYSDFLTLAPNGPTLLDNAKTALQSAGSFFSLAYTALKNETGSQDNDLFVLESEGDDQEFQNILAAFSEVQDSLTDNRFLSFQEVDTVWNVTTNNPGDTLILDLSQTLLGNGDVFWDESYFHGTIDGDNIQGWIPYWHITGSNIELTLNYWGYVRIEMTGTLAANGLSMSGAWIYYEHDGSGYQKLGEGTFIASRTSQNSDDEMRVDLNKVFGNIGKAPLDIRAILPEFDMLGEPKSGTFPDPVLNGIIPDLDTNAKLGEELDLDLPYKLFYIEEITPAEIDGNPSVWADKFRVNTDSADDFFPGWTEVQGIDILSTYLAKDDNNLYLAMSLAGAPMQVFPGTNKPVIYQFEIRKDSDDWSRNVLRIHAWYNQDAQGWNVNISKADANGNETLITTLGSEVVVAGDTYLKWSVPLTDLDALETYGGDWITSGTWSQAIHDGDWMDANTKLAPVYTISGSVSLPMGYDGGKIYFYLTQTENFPLDGNAIIGTYVDAAGNFILKDAPYSAQNLYLHILWDTDGNGIPNPGDYRAVKNFNIQDNVTVGEIRPQNTLSDFPLEAVSVKSVHSGDNNFRTFFEVVVGQGFLGNVPADIASISATGPDGTTHLIYTDGGAGWDSVFNEFFYEIPGTPALGKYVFMVTAKDGRIGVKSDIQKDLITIPIVDVNKVKINTDSKTPVFSWEPVSAPGTGIAYRLEIREPGNDVAFFRTGRDWNMKAVAATGLLAGQEYQYRIRACDHSDWIQVDNRSHTNWTNFTMGAALGHAAVPAIDLNGWGAVKWSSVGQTPGIDLEVRVIDHDGVAYNGSSHHVYARPIDAGGNIIGEDTIDLNHNYSENGIMGVYNAWINSENVPATAAGVRFFANDLDDVQGTINDFISDAGIEPPADINLSCSVNGTTPTFSWNAFTRANHYRVRIYDENYNTVWRGYPGNVTTYTLPAGVLEPNTFYRYRLEARDSHTGFEIDYNLSSHSSDNYPSFTTGNRVDKPFIDASSSGVETWSDNYRGTLTDFWIKVYDAQGVPGNIKEVKVIHPDTTTQTPLYYEYNESANCAIYSNHSYATLQPGTYTFVATDNNGNSFSLKEVLTISPIGYPAESSLSVDVTNTGAVFDWDDVTGAGFYRLEIYNKFHERIFKFVTTQSQYDLAPGFLKAGELYSFRVTTRREFWDQNTDNGSSSPWSSYRAINFKALPADGNGSNLPSIDTNNFGVAVTYLKHPKTGDPAYWLQFSVKVTDKDGVPQNIKSVTVQGPGITESLVLNYDWQISENTAEYWCDKSYDEYLDIKEGLYTFTVEDEDGNKAVTTDTLVKSQVPLVPYGKPAGGDLVSADRPVIDWADLAGGPYFYKVRIYQHWNRLVHDSGILSASAYVVPEGTLEPGEIYGYRIYAFDKDIRISDVDNLSINEIFFTKYNHFITQSGGSPVDWDLSQIFKLMPVLVGQEAQIDSLEGDLNKDGRLDMKDIIPMVQWAGDLR